MGKNELVMNISQRTGLAKEPCEAVIDAFAEEIKDALVNGEKVMIRGFMSFDVGTRREHDARNPKTGEMELCPAVKTVKCKVGQAIKDAVNGK